MQAEGRFEMLALVEENVAIKVPVGADFIQSPGRLPCTQATWRLGTNACGAPAGTDWCSAVFPTAGGFLYHIKWVQDEQGSLKMQDYWRDPVSTAVVAGTGSVQATAASTGDC